MGLKVLVTGGSGFIGKYVVIVLQNYGMEVINWDLTNGHNLFKETKVPDGTDIIIHLAAQLEILNVDPIPELDMNVKGTLHMLELARKGHVPKFIFFSSAAVYGEPRSLPSKESSSIEPFWSYGASKVAAEAYVKQYHELYGMNVVIIRPSIVTGIGEWYGRFLTLNIARARKGEPLLVFGDGQQTRDFIDVKDVVYLTLLCIKSTSSILILNAGSDEATPIWKVAEKIQRFTKSSIKSINPKVGEFGRKPHELLNMRLSMESSKKVFGWLPESNLKRLIEEEVIWIMEMSDKEFKAWSKVARY